MYACESNCSDLYIAPFSVYDQREAVASFGVSVRYLYKIRDRIEILAILYETLTQIEGIH